MYSKSRLRGFVAIILSVWSLCWRGAAFASAQSLPDAPRIAAAADLQGVMPELIAAFTRSFGEARAGGKGGDAPPLEIVFGSSGNFAAQIVSGAPFDVFFSADARYAQKVVAAGRALGAPQRYGLGRLALWSAHRSPVPPEHLRADGTGALARAKLRRVALPNPNHAPYGARAKEALERLGYWNALQGRIVVADNAAEALRAAETLSADVAFAPLALVLLPRLRQKGDYILLDSALHAPLEQYVVVLSPPRGASAQRQERAAAFVRFTLSPAGKAVLSRYGFTP
jgi:molybdate transport system substrate-binding protein